MDNTILGSIADVQVSPSEEMKKFLKDMLFYFALVSVGLIVIKFALSKI